MLAVGIIIVIIDKNKKKSIEMYNIHVTTYSKQVRTLHIFISECKIMSFVAISTGNLVFNETKHIKTENP